VFRPTDMVLIAVMVSAAALTYKIKRDAEDELAHVRKLQSAIHFEEDTITLLKADWSLLTQPVRLQRLSERFQADLSLQPVDPHQYARIAEIPMRGLDIQQIIDQSHDMVAGQDTLPGQGEVPEPATDDTITGAVDE
jgi:hypothetical protein